MGEFVGGLLVGIAIGALAIAIPIGDIVKTKDERIKKEYIRLEMAYYNTTTGAFEFKEKYKELGK